MPTRSPKCVDCGGSIEPKLDRYHITNTEEAMYGQGALYAHDECPVVDADTPDDDIDVDPSEAAVAASSRESESADRQRSVSERS